MGLTKAERADINRRNAQASTGPTSPEGKEKASRNAIKHGLRAAAHSLPNEDPRTAEQRFAAWYDFYQPVSPAAHHLVNECARATLMSDRLHRAYCGTAAAAVRIAHAENDRRTGVAATLQDAKDGIDPKFDPAPALQELARTGAGCRAMLERWGWYLSALRYNHLVSPGSAPELLRMLGHPPDAPLKHDPDGWVLHLLVALTLDHHPDDRLAALFDPATQPECLRAEYRADALPDRDRAAEELSAVVRGHQAWWSSREESYRADWPGRTEAADRALVPPEPVAARLLVRYQSEARISFHQAYKALLATLQYDAEHAREAPDEPPPEPAPGASPNEANPSESASEPALDQGVKSTPPAASAAPAGSRPVDQRPVTASQGSPPSVSVPASPPEPHRRA